MQFAEWRAQRQAARQRLRFVAGMARDAVAQPRDVTPALHLRARRGVEPGGMAGGQIVDDPRGDGVR
ncbi:hypothetical protein AAFM48_22885 [Burkholderia pseudomallei]